MLCNQYREGGMIKKTGFIKIKNGKTIKLKKQLN